jgi:hypothetical protein
MTSASLGVAALLGAWQWARVVQGSRQGRGSVQGWSRATPARMLALTRPYYWANRVLDPASGSVPCAPQLLA